jgi:hypothetical protein
MNVYFFVNNVNKLYRERNLTYGISIYNPEIPCSLILKLISHHLSYNFLLFSKSQLQQALQCIIQYFFLFIHYLLLFI